MAFQQVPLTVQVTNRYLLFGQIVVNVYDVYCPDGIDATVLADIRDTYIDWNQDEYMPLLSHDCFFTGLELHNLDIENGSILAYTRPTPLAGGANEASEPGNVSFCVSGRTAQSGRSHRGRKYVAGMPVGSRTGNQVAAAWAGDLITAFNTLLTLLTAIDKVLVVVSRVADHLDRVVAVTTPITGFTYKDLDIDSQRRRLTGRGQ